jgi:hypothetical protein
MKSKKIILFLLFLISIILIITAVFVKKNNKNLLTYSLNKKQYRLLIADTPAKWEKGLMFFRKLDRRVDGMIFLFPDRQYRSFWNKNTYMDLDLYWLNDEKVVGKSFLPSIEKSKEIVVVNSSKPVNKVIELPAGH